ncbi:hypothetical protein SASPL_112778 [Salvia splendens]|uniref:Uncharacterized protein n=1 Tax=Salvia splendens TaxID=180675 RepID=A0A8X8Y9F8_SALSN|nr:hypothetical protein SASPL_112778 [Salvia splendens]
MASRKPSPNCYNGPIKRNQKCRLPRDPPLGIDDPTDLGDHDHRGRVIFPRPPEVGPGRDVPPRPDAAAVDGEARVLVRVGFALRRDGVVLPSQRLARLDAAVLEDRGGVAEDEVDGARDGAVAVELAVGVRVEGVLVGVEAAAVEDGAVGGGSDGRGLELFWAGGVLEAHVHRHEAAAFCDCKDIFLTKKS